MISAYIEFEFEILTLTKNMRLQDLDSIHVDLQRRYGEMILTIGEGKNMTMTLITLMMRTTKGNNCVDYCPFPIFSSRSARENE
jgi:hypothetical protein